MPRFPSMFIETIFLEYFILRHSVYVTWCLFFLSLNYIFVCFGMKMSNTWELELQIVGSCHVGAGNWTRVLGKNRKCSQQVKELCSNWVFMHQCVCINICRVRYKKCLEFLILNKSDSWYRWHLMFLAEWKLIFILLSCVLGQQDNSASKNSKSAVLET